VKPPDADTSWSPCNVRVTTLDGLWEWAAALKGGGATCNIVADFDLQIAGEGPRSRDCGGGACWAGNHKTGSMVGCFCMRNRLLKHFQEHGSPGLRIQNPIQSSGGFVAGKAAVNMVRNPFVLVDSGFTYHQKTCEKWGNFRFLDAKAFLSSGKAPTVRTRGALPTSPYLTLWPPPVGNVLAPPLQCSSGPRGVVAAAGFLAAALSCWFPP
jgi:hypothetical protein